MVSKVNGITITIHRQLPYTSSVARAIDALLDGHSRLAGNAAMCGDDGAAAGHPAALLIPASPERPTAASVAAVRGQ